MACVCGVCCGCVCGCISPAIEKQSIVCVSVSKRMFERRFPVDVSSLRTASELQGDKTAVPPHTRTHARTQASKEITLTYIYFDRDTLTLSHNPEPYLTDLFDSNTWVLYL